MRKYIIIFLILVAGCTKPFEFFTQEAKGDTIYVAKPPTGSDSNPGTITQPFRTLTAAFNTASAGDTIYIRGGRYTYSEIGLTTLSNRSGTALLPIKIFNYPGEHPVFDYIDYVATTTTRALRIDNCDYIHLKGLEIKNLRQGSSGTNNGIYVGPSSDNTILEQLNVHHIGGWGIVIYGGSNTNGRQANNTHVLNCDSHHHSDRRSGWGGSDGFLMNSYDGYAYPSTGTVYENCRAWWNSDDGWDNRLFNGDVTYKNCQAWMNGYQPGETDSQRDYIIRGGNGYGFKLGSIRGAHTASVLRTMTGCIAFYNRETGIQCEWSDRYASDGTPLGFSFSSHIYNNTSYSNGMAGFSCGALVAPAVTTLRNNLSYGNAYDIVSNSSTISDEYNASNFAAWARRDFVSTSSDFASLDSAGMTGARDEDGSLPILNFLRLREASPLVNAGIDVGLPYVGSPEIGAYEIGLLVTTPIVVTLIPTVVSTTSATSGGVVAHEGNVPVTARGVCWSESPYPTVANSHTSDGSGIGSFSSTLTGLTTGVTYYVRAYATNSEGTSYGSTYSFSTDIALSGRPRGILMHDGKVIMYNGKIVKY